MTTHRIHFGSRTIDFQLVFADRKTLRITVTPEMEVLVKAPRDASLEKIREKIRHRAPWILKQQSFFLHFHPKTPARQYVSGETHHYLGRQYRLKHIEAATPSVKLKGGFLEVHTPHSTQVEALLKAWYLKQAHQKLLQYATPWIERFRTYGVEPREVHLREMPTRWGSCSAQGKIILNPELVKAPKGCIEYVIIHELCHLIHHNHTRRFLDLQAREMPDWEKWKMRLEALLA